MERLLFPPESALGQRYPHGFAELANAVYPVVSSNGSLRAAYDVDGIRPGVVAIAEAIGYLLDVSIHDDVLVDMQGFLDLVDALGGVTVNVTKRIPIPGDVPGATGSPETIGPATVHIDGSTALGYVRGRYAGSDFQRTSLTPDELAETLALIGGETAVVESVGLVPPLTSMAHPDFQRLAEVVGQVRLLVAEGRPPGS